MKKMYKAEIDCPNCANKMELAINKLDGIDSAIVNFMTQKITVEFTDGADIKSVMKNVLKACKKIESDCEVYF